MAAEFIDYKRSPSFWFLFALLIGKDICEHPTLSVKVKPLVLGEGDDMFHTIEMGLQAYEDYERMIKSYGV